MILYSVNVGLTQALVRNATHSLWKLLNNNSLSKLKVLEILISIYHNDGEQCEKISAACNQYIGTFCWIHWMKSSDKCLSDIAPNGVRFQNIGVWNGDIKKAPLDWMRLMEMQQNNKIRNTLLGTEDIKWMSFVNGPWLYASHISPLEENAHFSYSLVPFCCGFLVDCPCILTSILWLHKE